jgi:hypothetical protein
MTKISDPSGNVTGRKSLCIYIFDGTFPLGSGFFGIHSQEPSRKVTFSFSRHSANLQVTYSDVFIEPLGAHTLLGTVMQLFSPSAVHLYMDKPAGDLLWTIPRVV